MFPFLGVVSFFGVFSFLGSVSLLGSLLGRVGGFRSWDGGEEGRGTGEGEEGPFGEGVLGVCGRGGGPSEGGGGVFFFLGGGGRGFPWGGGLSLEAGRLPWGRGGRGVLLWGFFGVVSWVGGEGEGGGPWVPWFLKIRNV